MKFLVFFFGFWFDFGLNGIDSSDDMVREKYIGVMVVLEVVSCFCYLVFFVIVFYSGMIFGMIMGFFFWYLEDCFFL